MKEALHSVKENSKIHCTLCPHHCKIAEGKTGICNVRENRKGVLYTTNYGWVSALGIDPIEKKPLYHFYPGAPILSLGSFGCNLSCRFCQNWQISQVPRNFDYERAGEQKSVEDILQIVKGSNNNLGIAYTYNEPIIYYEYMLDIAKEIKKIGLKNVMVSNGYINLDPLHELLPVLDACNIDLKAFTNEFYKKQTGSSLQPVLESIKTIYEAGVHLELTNLLIPGLNDERKTFQAMIDWILQELGADTVLHLSRYFPGYQSKLPATEMDVMNSLYEYATENLNYVYLGNVGDIKAATTYCPSCNNVLIKRHGYRTVNTGVTENGDCKHCGLKVFQHFSTDYLG